MEGEESASIRATNEKQKEEREEEEEECGFAVIN